MLSENEIYLSFKRIKSNFIKKIWILIIAIIIGIAAIFVNALYSYKKTVKSSETVVNSNQMYEADVYLQISKNSNERGYIKGLLAGFLYSLFSTKIFDSSALSSLVSM